MAESDLSYTQALMHKGKEDFKGKEILILGGGDGALLWELLKEEPGFVTMVDVSKQFHLFYHFYILLLVSKLFCFIFIIMCYERCKYIFF